MRNIFTCKYSTHFKSEKNWSISCLMLCRKSFCRNQYEIKNPKLVPDTKLICHCSISILIKCSTAIANARKKVTILIIFTINVWYKPLDCWLLILKQRLFGSHDKKKLMQFICQGNSMLKKLYSLIWRQLATGKKSRQLSLYNTTRIQRLTDQIISSKFCNTCLKHAWKTQSSITWNHFSLDHFP